MKKLILCGLAGVLAMLLVQSPADLQAMDSGMMGSEGYRGYDMGPGLIRYGGYQADGMGPSMMGSSKKLGRYTIKATPFWMKNLPKGFSKII